MDLAMYLAREGPSVTHGHLFVPSAIDTGNIPLGEC